MYIREKLIHPPLSMIHPIVIIIEVLKMRVQSSGINIHGSHVWNVWGSLDDMVENEGENTGSGLIFGSEDKKSVSWSAFHA